MPTQYITLSLLILAVLAAGFVLSPPLQIMAGVFYIAFFSITLGAILAPNEGKSWQACFGCLALAEYISIAGAIIYFFWQLNLLEIFFILAALPFLIFPFLRRVTPLPSATNSTDKSNPPYSPLILRGEFYRSIAFLLFNAALLFLFIRSNTTASIRSPWEAVPSYIFILYFLTCLLLICLISLKPRITNLFFLILFFVTSFSAALLVYKVGYGFDSFIHQATEKAIASYGLILPKPLYYLGQYSLVVILSKLFLAPVEWIDKLLLPFLSGIFLPLVIFWSFSKITIKRITHSPLLITLAFLALPFSSFIVTTPQGLANLFTLLVFFLGLPLLINNEERIMNYGKPYLLFIILLAFASLAIHPLAGIPTLFFVLLLFLVARPFSSLYKKALIAATALLAAFALPLVFIIYRFVLAHNALGVELLPPTMANLLPRLSFYHEQRFNALLDLVYLYGFNLNILLLFFTAIGCLWCLKTKQYLLLLYPFFSLIIIINAGLIKTFFTFSSLIKYEQGAFVSRLSSLAVLCLTPFLLVLGENLIKHVLAQKNRVLKLSWVFVLALALTTSFYLSYPRVDAYEMSHGYSVSTADQQAVKTIHTDAKEENYLVLYNQAVSAAAVQAYGFPTRYAIPTSSRSYAFYLKMAYENPSAETMREAMQEAGVNLGYFVVNKYWWQSDIIIRRAKREAEKWWEIEGGKIVIFKYLNTPK